MRERKTKRGREMEVGRELREGGRKRRMVGERNGGREGVERRREEERDGRREKWR